MVFDYWKFMHRAPSKVLTTTLDEHPTFWWMAVQSSLFFCCLVAVIPYFTKQLFPKFFESLDKKKRQEFAPYVACLIHHAVVVPFAVNAIWQDVLRDDSAAEQHNYAQTDGWIVCYTFGYMVADTLFFALKEAVVHGDYEFLCHHSLSIALVATVVQLPGPTTRFVPHVLLCELSQLFFVVAYVLKLVASSSKVLVTLATFLEAIFVVTFILTRIVNLPVTTFRILDLCGKDFLTLLQWQLWPLVALQFYWLFKIFRGIADMLRPPDDNKVK